MNKIRILFLYFFIGCYLNLFSQNTTSYLVEGIYLKTDEETALNSYHYIEYDDVYYIEVKYHEGETHGLTISRRINSKLYLFHFHNDKNTDMYLYLRNPADLWEGEDFYISYSELADSDLYPLD